jgi:prevent-host-death family protein
VRKQLSLAEDIVPIGEFKTHASAYVRRVKETRGPVVITQNGRATAVIVSAQRYEELEYREWVREAIRAGIESAETERTYKRDEVLASIRLAGRKRTREAGTRRRGR